jgi:N-acetylmuramoyl-L-alanine amidase
LGAAGFQPAGIDPGVYGVATEAAVRAFQRARGLTPHGECDEATWTALVEAGWELGDRHLYRRAPMLRGDDVALLQRQLGQLGFDAGRVDGIFGPDTERAVAEFQRNVGLPPDGICGHATVRYLQRFTPRIPDPFAVAEIRELDLLRQDSPAGTTAGSVLLAHEPSSGSLARAIATQLRRSSILVITTDHPSESKQAEEANRVSVDCFIALCHEDEPGAAYYGVPGFESIGGKRLVHMMHAALVGSAGVPVGEVRGMRLAVLRETKMPAVVLQLPPLDAATPAVAIALATAVAKWLDSPLPG